MKVAIAVIATWIFAVWWLVVGFLDFNTIRYDARGSRRYRKKLPLLLCLAASSSLTLLGYFLWVNNRLLTMISLAVFALISVAWTILARLSWNWK
jgi:hypothetical protein